MTDFTTQLFETASGFPRLLDFQEPWLALKALNLLISEFPLGVHHSTPHSSAILIHPEKIYIGKNVQIDPFVTLIGPLAIGDGSVIRSGAYIRPYSILAADTLVGAGSEIKGSILLQGAKAPHKNTVLDSIIGCDVNLGALATCANLRLDEKDVCVRFSEGVKIPTNMRKLGAFIGNRSKIACALVLNPGTIIFKDSHILQSVYANR